MDIGVRILTQIARIFGIVAVINEKNIRISFVYMDLVNFISKYLLNVKESVYITFFVISVFLYTWLLIYRIYSNKCPGQETFSKRG